MTLAQRNLELSVSNFLKQKISVTANAMTFSSSTPTHGMNMYEASRDTLEKTVCKYKGPNMKLYVAAHDWMINHMLSKACTAMTFCDRDDEAKEIMTKLINSEIELEKKYREIDYSRCLEHGTAEEELVALAKGFRTYGEMSMYEKMHASQWFVKMEGCIWDTSAIQDFQDHLDEFLPIHA